MPWRDHVRWGAVRVVKRGDGSRTGGGWTGKSREGRRDWWGGGVNFPREHETVLPEALGTAKAARAVIKSTGPSKLHGVCQVAVYRGRSGTIVAPDRTFTVIHQR